MMVAACMGVSTSGILAVLHGRRAPKTVVATSTATTATAAPATSTGRRRADWIRRLGRPATVSGTAPTTALGCEGCGAGGGGASGCVAAPALAASAPATFAPQVPHQLATTLTGPPQRVHHRGAGCPHPMQHAAIEVIG